MRLTSSVGDITSRWSGDLKISCFVSVLSNAAQLGRYAARFSVVRSESTLGDLASSLTDSRNV
jgi:hypothetical protein